MGKSKKKVITKTLGGSGDELNAIFSQLMGNEDSLDPMVILDKYNNLKGEVNTILDLLSRLNIRIIEKMLLTDDSFKGNKEDIEFFIKSGKKEFDNPSYTISEIVPIYKRIKNCNVINQIIIMCKNLSDNKSSLREKNELSDRFIYSHPGNELLLFPFTDLNFKYLFRSSELNREENLKMKPYIMMTLHLLYKVSYSVYKIITSPDIDINKFSEIIIKSINEAKKSVPRCEKAFNKISNSLEMLTGNFENYYKDFIDTKTPSIIIENFLIDVTKDTSDSDMECVMQLKKIVGFYKNKTMNSGAIKDPRINQLFETIQEKFNLIDDEEDEGEIVEEESIGEDEVTVEDIEEKV